MVCIGLSQYRGSVSSSFSFKATSKRPASSSLKTGYKKQGCQTPMLMSLGPAQASAIVSKGEAIPPCSPAASRIFFLSQSKTSSNSASETLRSFASLPRRVRFSSSVAPNALGVLRGGDCPHVESNKIRGPWGLVEVC